MSERVKLALEQRGEKKVRTKRFNLTVAKNGGKLPVIFDDTNPEDAPPQFQKVTVEFDKTAVRKALEAGDELSFASFGERKTHLRIR